MPSEVNILVYGRSGTGKTHFAGTAPKPLLVLDVNEKGHETLAKVPDVFYSRIEEWSDLEDMYWFLKEGEHDYKTVAIDTVSGMQDLALREVIGQAGGSISQRGWGEAAGLMKSWIIYFRDLPLNTIFVAQDRLFNASNDSEDDTVDEGAIAPEIGPHVMPSVGKTLNAAVGIIGNTFIMERFTDVTTKGGDIKTKRIVNYCMRLGPHSRYMTKIRSSGENKIPDHIVNPSFEQVMAISRGDEE